MARNRLYKQLVIVTPFEYNSTNSMIDHMRNIVNH